MRMMLKKSWRGRLELLSLMRKGKMKEAQWRTKLRMKTGMNMEGEERTLSAETDQLLL